MKKYGKSVVESVLGGAQQAGKTVTLNTKEIVAQVNIAPQIVEAEAAFQGLNTELVGMIDKWAKGELAAFDEHCISGDGVTTAVPAEPVPLTMEEVEKLIADVAAGKPNPPIKFEKQGEIAGTPYLVAHDIKLADYAGWDGKAAAQSFMGIDVAAHDGVPKSAMVMFSPGAKEPYTVLGPLKEMTMPELPKKIDMNLGGIEAHITQETTHLTSIGGVTKTVPTGPTEMVFTVSAAFLEDSGMAGKLMPGDTMQVSGVAGIPGTTGAMYEGMLADIQYQSASQEVQIRLTNLKLVDPPADKVPQSMQLFGFDIEMAGGAVDCVVEQAKLSAPCNGCDVEFPVLAVIAHSPAAGVMHLHCWLAERLAVEMAAPFPEMTHGEPWPGTAIYQAKLHAERLAQVMNVWAADAISPGGGWACQAGSTAAGHHVRGCVCVSAPWNGINLASVNTLTL